MDTYEYPAEVVQARTAKAKEMRQTLSDAAEQFASYATQHRAKGTPDGDAKAKVNDAWAARCRRAAEWPTNPRRNNGHGDRGASDP